MKKLYCCDIIVIPVDELAPPNREWNDSALQIVDCQSYHFLISFKDDKFANT